MAEYLMHRHELENASLPVVSNDNRRVWGAAPEILTARYPALTPPIQREFLIAAHAMAKKHSLNPSTQVGAVAANSRGDIVAVGINNFLHGFDIELLKNYPANRSRCRDFNQCAEQGMLYACAAEGISTKDLIVFVPHHPCDGCAKGLLIADVDSVVFDPSSLTEDFLSRWGTSIETSNMLLRDARPANPILAISLPITQGDAGQIEIDRLPANSLRHGVAFAKPIPYESLLKL